MNRSIILWCGQPPDAEYGAEFDKFELTLRETDGVGVDESQLLGALGVVYGFSNGNVGEIRCAIETTARTYIDHGLSVVIIANNDAVYQHIEGEVRRWDLHHLVKIKIAPSPGEMIPAHLIAREFQHWAPHPPSYSSQLNMKLASGAALNDTVRLLLGRAFADCREIYIDPIGGGRTAETFMIRAVIENSQAGPRPLPFFAKVGASRKISEEQWNYSRYAANYIPFHLRPNIEIPRCVHTSKMGILVGNFIEKSEPLWNAAANGKGHSAIHSLFDVTLASWRMQGFERKGGPVAGPVAGALSVNIFDHYKARSDLVDQAREDGLKRSPKEIWEALIGADDQHYYFAPMHGDLHPGNVFVRNGDAILIDLASVQDGPLSGDLACLETSFGFDLRELKPEYCPSIAEWRKSIDELYAEDAFVRLPPPAKSDSQWDALWNCARQVRQIALPTQACPTEYASAVAVYLLRRSMFEAYDEFDAYARSYALVVADRLAAMIENWPGHE